MSEAAKKDYAGDVLPAECFKALAEGAGGQLVDVRTRAEWSFVGVPDLRICNKEPILAEWQSWPAGTPQPDFAADLQREFARRHIGFTDPLYFLCRSGVRSRAAAIAMTAAGHMACYNVVGGFEGPLDDAQHRGKSGGWKVDGLPWVQT